MHCATAFVKRLTTSSVYHGHGHLEKIYENALVHRLRKSGLEVEQQYPLHVFDEDGTLLGDFVADLLVEGELVVELKAVRAIVPEHTAQLLGYLKSAQKEHGLLINFGSYKFEIKKYVLSQEYHRSSRGGSWVGSWIFLLFSILSR